MIIEKTYDLLRNKYGTLLEKLIIDDVRIGLHLTAIRLSDGSIGTAATLTDSLPWCEKSNRDFGDFTPLKIKGQKASELLGTTRKSGTIWSLKSAVLNALSSRVISSGNYNIVENCDPVQLLDLNAGKTITIVGAFQSYIRKISESKSKLFVLELNENALSPEQKKFFIPAGEYKKILGISDVVIITGQTLVNKTIDDLLSAVSDRSQVVVTGPSSGIIPDILFENNVSIIGTIRITDPELMFDIVSEGGTGFHLFEYCAQKICILK